tara:strand:+ start:200 stop:850 length:651 start_codon:yes stop_codon:yes gene_type:complete
MTASYESVKALLSRGISKPSLYEVLMPLGAGPGNQDAMEQLRFLCSNTAVPPASVNTIAVNGHEAMGVTREQPTFVQFTSPFSVTVIADKDYTVYKSIKRWLDTIAINANPNSIGGVNGQSQRISYYDNFKKDIILKKLELKGGRGTREANSYSEPFRIVFNNAFPVNLGEISLSSENYDSRLEFTVDFAYETYSFVQDAEDIETSIVTAIDSILV